MDEQRQTRDKAKIPPVCHGLTVLVQEGKMMDKRITRKWWTMVTLALVSFAAVTAAQQRTKPDLDVQLKAASQKELVDGDPNGAIALYQKIVDNAEANHAAAAKALLEMGRLYGKIGKAEDQKKAYDRVLKDYSDQKEAVSVARTRLGGDVRSTSNANETTRQTTEEIFIGKTSTPGASPFGGPYGAAGTQGFYRPSPDGRYLAGSSTQGLLLHEVSLNTDRLLTTDGGFASEPCFTPDGRRIVYASFKDGRSEIRIINVDGTGERTILSSDEYGAADVSGITADGKSAALGLFRKDRTWQVGMVSLETGKLTILKDNEWRDTYVGTFSPDGRWLVYQAQVSKDDRRSGAVYTVATDGSAQYTLTPGTAADEFPFFTPDGSRVVFTVLREGRKDLWSVRVADGKPVGEPAIATTDIGRVMGFARDGSFYYNKFTLRASIYVAEVNPATWKLKSAPKEVSNAFRYDNAVEPAWSPDGKALAYRSEDKIVLHRFDGTPEREIRLLAGYRSLDGWAPDGKSLVVTGVTGDGTGLRFFDLETLSERTIWDLPLGVAYFSNTDSKVVFYITGDSAPLQEDKVPPAVTIRLMRHDLQTGAEKELYHTEALKMRVNGLTLSPDGRSLAFIKSDQPDGKSRSLWLLPVSGGEPRELLSVGATEGLLQVYWTQDSKALLWVRGGESSDEIWVQPVDGSAAYDTGIRAKGIDVSVHPDGSRIAFRKLTERVGQVMAVRNLFSKISGAK
jgi:Tol biopolymer transport system component